MKALPLLWGAYRLPFSPHSYTDYCMHRAALHSCNSLSFWWVSTHALYVSLSFYSSGDLSLTCKTELTLPSHILYACATTCLHLLEELLLLFSLCLLLTISSMTTGALAAMPFFSWHLYLWHVHINTLDSLLPSCVYYGSNSSLQTW